MYIFKLGQIDLKDVNFKPNKVNELLTSMSLPFMIKAGMIGKLSLSVNIYIIKEQYNLLSFLSNPFQVSIDDLQLILGPNTIFVSQGQEKQVEDDEYDSRNCYNIFRHRLKFTLSSKDNPLYFLDPITHPKEPEYNIKTVKEEQNSIQGYITNILKNITLTINRIHIRYEDDFFCQIRPFAFGIICDQISAYGSDTEWNFGSLENNHFNRICPK